MPSHHHLVGANLDRQFWTAQVSGIDDTLRSIAYNDGLWVACGDNGVILTSTDGETWTSRTSTITDSLRTVKYWNSNWWIVAYDGIRATPKPLKSADGITWAEVTIAGLAAGDIVSIGTKDTTETVTNSLLQSRTLDTTWLDFGSPTVAQDATGYDGGSNKAWTITDNSAIFSEYVYQTVDFVSVIDTAAFSVFIKKQGSLTHYAEVQTQVRNGGTTLYNQVFIDPYTGAITENLVGGTQMTNTVEDRGTFWKLNMTTINDGGDNTRARIFLYPVALNSEGAADPSLTGATVFDHVQLEIGVSAPSNHQVETTTVAVTDTLNPKMIITGWKDAGGGYVIDTEDGTTWTIQSTPTDLAWGYSVQWNSTDKVWGLAGGVSPYPEGYFGTSTDGENWQRHTTGAPSGLASEHWNINHNGTIWTLTEVRDYSGATAYSRVYTSTDTIPSSASAWSVADTGALTDQWTWRVTNDDSGNIMITGGMSGYPLYGKGAIMKSSNNGASWTISWAEPEVGGVDIISKAVYGNGYWIAVGDNGTILKSS